MKMKRLGAMIFAFALAASMSATAFAAEVGSNDVQISTNEAGETVYTQTFEIPLSAVPYATTGSKSAYANSQLGLALEPGKSGTSMPVTFSFSSIPASATVRSIEIKPSNPVINGNDKNLLGNVVFSSIQITSPEGDAASMAWNPRGMTDRTSFSGSKARGTWSATVTGKNTTNATSDPTWNTRAFGTLTYQTCQMTVTYVS